MKSIKNLHKLRTVPALVGLLLAGSVSSAQAIDYVGTADYTKGTGAAGDEEIVGPFDTYDFGAGVVLLKPSGPVGPTTSFNGTYQSYVTKHELSGTPVAAPKLDSTYELTAVANFTQSVTQVSPTVSQVQVTGGTFKLYRDTTPDRSFTLDTGFSDGDVILAGTILSGAGSASTMSGMIFGVNDLNIRVDTYNTSIFNPKTIAGGEGIFTLRLGSSSDAAFLAGITRVGGNTVTPNDLKFAADGNVVLSAVPEPATYGMLIAGLGLVGFTVRRRKQR